MKMIVCGALGRMGSEVCRYALERGDEVFGVDIGVEKMSGKADLPIFDRLGKAPVADVLVDFSSPRGIGERLKICKERHLPAVLGATGYSEEEQKAIDEAAEQIPLFVSGNFSLGINLLRLLVKKSAAVLDGYDIEIVERHHNQKKDAPSGTALMLAKSAEEGLGVGLTKVYGREGNVGARGEKEIGIHAVRGGNIVGEHEVMFAGEDEIVSLSHSARSRKVFAVGAYRAAHWLPSHAQGKYGMDDLLASMTEM